MSEGARVTVADATRRILAACAPLGRRRVALRDALGRVLATPVTSPIDQPSWDNSAMDGFAVRADDVRGASPDSPVQLRVVEAVPAGGFPTRAVGAGDAIRIMTGAPVPDGADSVVRVEHTRAGDAGAVVVLAADDALRNIRSRGEDVRAGAVVLEAGVVLRPAEIGVLAMIGCAEVDVYRRPRVAIFSTGDELVPLDAFEEVRAGRRIVDSNTWALTAAARVAGAVPLPLGIARDDADSLRGRVAAAADADVLVTTAGASVGDHDIVKDVLEELGMRRHFWRVRMRPGSPFSFGELPRPGRAPLWVFGLPGNPVSALVTWEVLVRPALRRLGGRRLVHTRTVPVVAGEHVASKRGLTHFLRVRLAAGEDGTRVAWLTGPQGSGILTSMARADALLIVPAAADGLAEGDEARVLRLRDDDAGGDFQLE